MTTTGLYYLMVALGERGRLGINAEWPDVLFVDRTDPPPSWEEFMNDDWDRLTTRQQRQALKLWDSLTEKTRRHFLT